LLVALGILFVGLVICWVILAHNSSILYPTIVRGDRAGNRIALTFDDGPHPEYTTRALEVLAKHGTRATFFCLGSLVEEHPEIARRMHNEGHLVANHDFDHSLRDFFQPPGITHEFIVKTALLIRDITGYFPRFYRPPVGIKTPPRVLSVYHLGLTCVGWSRHAVDGGHNTLCPEKAAKMAARTRSGDILLLHDGKMGKGGERIESEDSCVDVFGRALESLLEALQDKGLKPVRLDRLLKLSPGLENPAAATGDTSLQLVMAPLRALIHEKASPAWLCISLGVGIVIGCSPFFGLHYFIGMVVALRLRLHKLAVFVGTNITNPLLAPFVIFASLQAGWWILHGESMPMTLASIRAFEFSELLKRFLTCWLVGFPVVGTGLAVLTGTVLYPILALRRWIQTLITRHRAYRSPSAARD